MPPWWTLALALGATARISRFLVADALAAPVRARLAARYGDHSLLAYLVRCAWCVSIWVALPVTAAAATIGDRAWFWAPALWLSLSYGTGLLASWAERD